MKSLAKELQSKLEQYRPKIETVFIGGGTPSTITAKEYAPIFKLIKPFLSEGAEITTEANPNSATKEWLKTMQDLGVNRVSFGVQSFHDEKLKFLGRAHSSNKAIEAIKEAHNIGFKNINCDLIYGVANDTMELLKKDIDTIASLPVNHVSAYSLTLEEGTKFYQQTDVKIDDEVLSAEVFDYLQEKGFEQYEISNFALNDEAQSKHNLGYWQYKEYLGIGAGAVGCIENNRTYAQKDIHQFIENPNNYEIEALSQEDIKTEKILLGLRSVVGFEKDLLNRNELNKVYELIHNKQLIEKEKRLYSVNYLLADEIALYILE